MVELAERTALAVRPWLGQYDPGVPTSLESDPATVTARLEGADRES